jgi:hypothetical protein
VNGSSIGYTAGNVGVGTTTPSFKLHVYGNIDAGVEQYVQNASSVGTSAYCLIGCRNNTPSSFVMFLNSSTRTGDGGVSTGTLRNDAGDLRLQSSSATNGIHIKGGTGNVGIGTTTPSTLLDVRGTIFGTSIQAVSGGAYANAGYVTLQAGNATNTGHIEFRNSDTSRMCYIGYGDASSFYFNVEQSRNLIFNTNSVERMRIANTGDVTCTGDISAFASTSDIRLKENIIVLPSALNIIKMLNPVTFTWKHDIYNEMYRGKEDVGFIAQEVEQVIPKAVGEFTIENNTYKKIRHERILPYVVKSVQELNTTIDCLQSENNMMKNTIMELTNENNSMKEQLARLMAWAQTMGMN